MLVVITNDGELDGVARGEFADESGEGASATDFNAIDFGDDIACFQAGFFGGATGGDGVYIASSEKIGALGNGEFVGFGDIGREVNIVGTEIGPGSLAGGNEIFEHAFDAGNGDGEADTVGVGAGGGVDADDLASGIDKRAARVAGVDSGVSLDHIGEVFGGGHITIVGSERATSTGDDTGSNSVLVLAKGVADGNDLLAGVDGF